MESIKTTIFILMFLGSGFFFYSHFSGIEEPKIERGDNLVAAALDGTPLVVEVAGTKESLRKGLSGRDSIGSDGLLMVFLEEGMHSIWMKDMNFAIDIVWMDSYGRVVFVEENVLPETYPDVFSPHTKSKFVLEVDAGRVEREGWKVGSLFIIKNEDSF